MLQTFEAVLEPNGHLQFLEATRPQLSESCRVLVTFTQNMSTDERATGDWKQYAGSLKNSPSLNGDPLTLQQDMRHEWD